MRILRNILAIIGGMTVFICLMLILFTVIAVMKRETVPEKTFLELDFSQGIAEYVQEESPSQLFSDSQLQLIDAIRTLDRAAHDSRITGIVAYLGFVPMNMARIQDIRDAIIQFRKSGKPAIAWADTFGEMGPGNRGYYLATAFDKIYVQPSGEIGLTGIIMESPFIRGTLNKLGITPRMDHRYEYKNFLNIFTEERYTDAHKEVTTRIMESFFQQLVSDIANARELRPDVVRELMDQAPLTARQALEAGLIDGIAYRDEVYEQFFKAVGQESDPLSLAQYHGRVEWNEPDSGNTIALIYGVGGIQRGESHYDPFSSDHTLGSRTVCRAFRKAVEDDTVKAIVFRINSPGGSYVASDSIWRETIQAKAKGKPVIVSMGDVAGSGGYFIAMAADRIVAQPATITGSIGVLGGKMVTMDFWKKLGVTWDEVHTSANSDMWTGTRDYSADQWERVQGILNRIYADFTQKVAMGRNIPMDEMDSVARGRIWSGADAKKIGLVDELGGLPEAIHLAKQAAGIAEDQKVALKIFPKKRHLIERLLNRMAENEAAMGHVSQLGQSLKVITPVLEMARQKGLLTETGLLSMPGPAFNW